LYAILAQRCQVILLKNKLLVFMAWGREGHLEGDTARTAALKMGILKENHNVTGLVDDAWWRGNGRFPANHRGNLGFEGQRSMGLGEGIGGLVNHIPPSRGAFIQSYPAIIPQVDQEQEDAEKKQGPFHFSAIPSHGLFTKPWGNIWQEKIMVKNDQKIVITAKFIP
jgi:hypothetical protein